MKHTLIVGSMLIATNAMALDFDTEWAKFSADFARLKNTKVTTSSAVVTPLPEINTSVNTLEQVDPKSPNRLGLKLADQSMVNKMKDLYSKPDTVVYSLTLE